MSFVIGSVNVAYGLAHVLAEEKKYLKAEQHLTIAARGISGRFRVLYDFLCKDPQQAEVVLAHL